MPLHLTPVLSYRWWANQSEKPCDVRGELITPTRSWEPSPYIYIYIYTYMHGPYIYARRECLNLCTTQARIISKLAEIEKWLGREKLCWHGKRRLTDNPTPVLGTFLPDFVTQTFPHYYWENREFMYAVFNKMSFMQSVSLNYSTTRDTVATGLCSYAQLFPSKRKN